MTRVTSFKRSLLGASSACLLWMLYAAVAGAASLSDAQLVTALRAHLEQLSAQDAFSGSVLVAGGLDGTIALRSAEIYVPDRGDAIFADGFDVIR